MLVSKLDIFDNKQNKQSSIYLTTNRTSKVRYIRQQVQQTNFFFQYIDFLDTTLLQIVFNLLQIFTYCYSNLSNLFQNLLNIKIVYSCKFLLSSNCLYCLKISTDLFNSTIYSNIFEESTSVTYLSSYCVIYI